MQILEDNFSEMEPEDRHKLVSYLTRENSPWTLIILSNDQDIQNACGRTIVMQYGAVILDAQGNDPQISKALKIS